jgi:hypothetical protein
MTKEDQSKLKLILTATESGLAEAWKKFCGDLEFVQIHEGSILDVSCDAVVSPANSYGFMDGGIDARYTQRWGWGVQERLRKLIVEKHHGELVVGAAEIVETADLTKPYLIAAPTMRVPMVLCPGSILADPAWCLFGGRSLRIESRRPRSECCISWNGDWHWSGAICSMCSATSGSR